MVHVQLRARPALVRTVLNVEGFDGRMLDLRPILVEIGSKLGRAPGNSVLLDRLEEFLSRDHLLEERVRIGLVIVNLSKSSKLSSKFR